MLQVGIVEGNQIIRWALKAAIDDVIGFYVGWAVSSMEMASDMLKESSPTDVIIVGYDVADYEVPNLPRVIQLALRAGPLDPVTLMEAIRSVAAGEHATVDPRGAAGMLTARERQVMELLARGKTNREIAGSLEISIKTVDTHRGHVLRKLELRNNAELARFAIGHKYAGL